MQVPSFETFQIQADLIFISGLLSQGWYVVVPDYEGPNSVSLWDDNLLILYWIV